MKRVPLDRDEFHLTKNRNSARGGQVLTDEYPAIAGFFFLYCLKSRKKLNRTSVIQKETCYYYEKHK